MPGYSPTALTKKMLNKYQSSDGGIKAVTDFRRVKQHIANARKAGKISILSHKLKEFIENERFTPDHLLIPAADVSAQARSLHGKVQKLQEALTDLDVEAYLGEEDLWRALESLLRTIRKCLMAADRRTRE
jgi:hypothetical protein